ncbi:uncharacterized domain 1 [Thermosinus carboxydivorans Nor1]|uniref:Uncharacterized domain 1 n=1 Tax=Thermosinus carboxydivorans Nor1 TaxID=401526 RepID=A1HTC1_9FIRM|nr:PaaI family thioesterase [Thermosinus carboxydivorans]EAX46734.1 uncharacterized domain 1 [Thermosinus carboxydivorans Nor1]
MVNNIEWLKEHLKNIYDRNPYVRLLQMSIAKIEEGRAELTMPVIYGKHTNLYGVAHGGALASLADTAMGVACATLGNRVVTIDMNINYIRGAQQQSVVKAVGTVVHKGKSTMVVEADVRDCAEDILLAKARGTFFVIGAFEKGEHHD